MKLTLARRQWSTDNKSDTVVPSETLRDETSSPEDVSDFFKVLGGGNPSSLREASTGGDDSDHEKNYDSKLALYKISDASGKIKIDQIAVKPLSRTSLNSDDAFILDTTSGIYAWVGKKSTKAEKEEAMKKAQEFLKSKNYPAWTPIARVVEGAESSTFKEYFKNW